MGMFQRQAVKVLNRLRDEYYQRLEDNVGNRHDNKLVINALGVAIKALARPRHDTWNNPAPDASPSPVATGEFYSGSISSSDRFGGAD